MHSTPQDASVLDAGQSQVDVQQDIFFNAVMALDDIQVEVEEEETYAEGAVVVLFSGNSVHFRKVGQVTREDMVSAVLAMFGEG